MKSPWNHHDITMKSPWHHHEIPCLFLFRSRRSTTPWIPSFPELRVLLRIRRPRAQRQRHLPRQRPAPQLAGHVLAAKEPEMGRRRKTPRENMGKPAETEVFHGKKQGKCWKTCTMKNMLVLGRFQRQWSQKSGCLHSRQVDPKSGHGASSWAAGCYLYLFVYLFG